MTGTSLLLDSHRPRTSPTMCQHKLFTNSLLIGLRPFDWTSSTGCWTRMFGKEISRQTGGGLYTPEDREDQWVGSRTVTHPRVPYKQLISLVTCFLKDLMPPPSLGTSPLRDFGWEIGPRPPPCRRLSRLFGPKAPRRPSPLFPCPKPRSGLGPVKE